MYKIVFSNSLCLLVKKMVLKYSFGYYIVYLMLKLYFRTFLCNKNICFGLAKSICSKNLNIFLRFLNNLNWPIRKKTFIPNICYISQQKAKNYNKRTFNFFVSKF